jgi:hypothetical protein
MRFGSSVKRLSEEDALQVVQEFLENSCRNHNNCNKVYDSFKLGDLQKVKSKGLKPTTLKTLVFSNITETRLLNITVYISDYIGFTSGIKSPSNEKPFRGVAFNRTLRMAEITVKAEPREPQEWEDQSKTLE